MAAPRHTVLERAEFDAAVRAALRAWSSPSAFQRNPLVDSRLALVDSRLVSGHRASPALDDTAAALRAVLRAAIDSLGADPRQRRFHQAASTTYLQGVPTQAAAAARLGLPFSTYRRHLSRAVDLISDHLWQQEVFGEVSR
jgi:hypothetical protein